MVGEVVMGVPAPEEGPRGGDVTRFREQEVRASPGGG